MRTCLARSLAVLLLSAAPAHPQADAPELGFRRGNESAARSRWDDAISEYSRLERAGLRAPSVYWNWAQAAAASGKRGEAVWALLRAQELTPRDASMVRELERLRGELGLDPSEISLGFLGEGRRLARRFRFDGLAVATFLLSILSLGGKKPKTSLSLVSFIAGLILIAPLLAGGWREARAVVVHKDAPLMDIPRNDAVALANLREGEVLPILGDEGEYVRIQDASGARGFAHKSDVRPLGRD